MKKGSGFDSSSIRPFDESTMLFVDYAVPMYDKYAGSRTNFMYLELLVKMGLTVKFLPLDFKRVEPYSSELNRRGIETLDSNEMRNNWDDWFKEHGIDIDFVFFNKPKPTIKFLQVVKKYTNAAVIYQCHDLHHLRLQRKAEIEGSADVFAESKDFARIENYIFENSDVILTFSPHEEKILKKKYPQKGVYTVPLYFYESVSIPKVSFFDRRDLLFVGSCIHNPNKDAIVWFSKEIFPLIQKHVPDIVFNVVGVDPPREILSLRSDHIKILGCVSDSELSGLYKRTKLAVIPLRFGAGIKGKLIEALYHGVPLVSTTIGLEGILGIEDIITARDEPSSFAEEVVALYENESEWNKVSNRAIAYIRESSTHEKAQEKIFNVLDSAVVEKNKRLQVANKPIRLISFFLPQYHPIAENDAWWGKGFTEWRNVAKAEPLFPGHYQPHLPADQGFYDLRLNETLVAQAELAKEYGIHGFCFYHYWFNGKRLLERPVEDMLVSGKPDFPFCLCWANENWTRRWDGEEQDILIAQEYSEEDDVAHIRDLLRFFNDKRYIRIDGKPLFLVYRTENIPNPAKTATIWRQEARNAGIGEIYLMRVESIGKCDPAEINFDAALEFAPDWWNKGVRMKTYPSQGNEAENDLAKYNDILARNYVHSYDNLIETMASKPIPLYKWMQCVTPSWDNTARRKEGAHVFIDSTPGKYNYWLKRAIDSTNTRLLGDEKIVFINAWNEWAEGNHLEPDQKYGREYLEATLAALHADGYMKPAFANEDNIILMKKVHFASSQKVFDLMTKLEDQERKIKSIERLLAQKARLIEQIHRSKSWKITKPLRSIYRILRSKKKRNNDHGLLQIKLSDKKDIKSNRGGRHANELFQKAERQIAENPNAPLCYYFSSWTIKDYGSLYLGDLTKYSFLNSRLPKMPTPEIQQHWSWFSDKAAIERSIDFSVTSKNVYETITGRLFADADVLDYGAGWGRLTRMILQFLPPNQVHACDADPKSVDLFNSLGFEIKCIQIPPMPSKLPFASKSFDFIWLWSIFTHLSAEACDRIMTCLHDIIRPDGLLLLTVRPAQFWIENPLVANLADKVALVKEHEKKGFAYSPIKDWWGNTSMSVDYIQRTWLQWEIVHVIKDHSHQNRIYLKPC